MRNYYNSNKTGTNKTSKGNSLKGFLFMLLFVITGLSQAQTVYYSKATATDFTDVNSWGTATNGTGTSPATISNADDFVIQNAAALTLPADASVRKLTLTSGSLTMSANTLTVSIAAANNTTFLMNGGTLNLNGGTLVVNGNMIVNTTAGKFNQSGGQLIIDPNSGVAGTSVAAGTTSLLFSVATGTVSGGTITIVDPNFNATGKAVDYNVTTTPSLWANAHTLQMGNGTSTDPSSNTSGFILESYTGTGKLSYGNLVINGGNGTNRWTSLGIWSVYINGTATIEAGSEFRANATSAPTTFSGNLINNGILTATAAVNFSATSLNVAAVNPNAQTISGSGVFRNLLTSPTANFTSILVNNSSASGVTLSVPLSVSGTLTLTAGIVNTSTANLLTLGTATAGGTLTGGSATAYINGPFVRTIASGNANTSYIVFPVGKGTSYAPISIAPLTTAVSVFKAETFNTNTGSASANTANLSTTRRWEVPMVSGAFTNINVRMGEASLIADNIAVQAPTANGIYQSEFGGTSTFASGTPNTITSLSSLVSANYTGFLSFATPAACTGTPTPGTTTATANNLCLGGTTTLGITNTTTGSGVTYQWQSSTDNVTYTNITGATATTLTVSPTAATYYHLVVTCATGSVTGTSTSLLITFLNNVATTTGGSVCGSGTVNLSATGNSGSTIKWFAAATGGNALATGSTFTTPSINTTTTYYAQASTVGGGSGNVGKVGLESNASGTGGGLATYMNFTAVSNFTLMTVDLYPYGTGAGTVTIDLRSSTGTTLMSQTFNVTGTMSTTSPAQTVTLNFPIVGGASYRLGIGAWTGGVTNLYRDSQNFTYPYTVPGVMSIDGPSTAGYFYFFYNWSISADCSSPRVPVIATVSTPPTLDLSSTTATICNGQSTTPITITTGASDYNTYTFLPTTGVSGTAGTGFTFNPTTTTTYTLTASQSSGALCSTTKTITITVNPVPSALTIATASATACANTPQALTATGGLIGTTGSSTVGTATTLTAQAGLEPTAFNNRYKHYWLQMVFTQAELLAAGVQAGNITSIKFNITSVGSATNVTDFRVFMGSTAQTVLTGFTTTGISEVYSTPTYNQVIGVNTIVFNTPYAWDGVSNVIVDIRSTGANSLNNAITYYTATTDNKTVTAVTTTALASSNAFVATNPAATTSLKRLNTTFDWSSSSPTNIVWSPTTNLYTDAAGTTAYTGTAATTVYYKSPTATAATLYTATATSPSSGCSTTGTTSIATAAPTAQPTAASPQSINSPVGNPATLANITITGTGVIWYATLANATAGTNALPTTTVLVDNTTYYATQTVGGCPSTPISVLVNVVLGNASFNMSALSYYPNPVTNGLNISYSEAISSIEVYNLLGQVVRLTQPNTLSTEIDMSGLAASTYLVKVTSEGKTVTIKVVKK